MVVEAKLKSKILAAKERPHFFCYRSLSLTLVKFCLLYCVKAGGEDVRASVASSFATRQTKSTRVLKCTFPCRLVMLYQPVFTMEVHLARVYFKVVSNNGNYVESISFCDWLARDFHRQC